MYQPQSKNVVFTFILNRYDSLKEPKIKNTDWDYICFTDDKQLKSDFWTLVYLDRCYFDNFPLNTKKRAMLIMILHDLFISKRYDIAVSIGGQIRINVDLNKFVNENFDIDKHDIAICLHPERTCIYDEAEECIKLKKDDKKTILQHINRYHKKKYPSNFGLYATGVIVRKNRSRRLMKMTRVWAEELINGSQRDQLSLNYAIWASKRKLRISEMIFADVMKRLDDSSPFIIEKHQQNKRK